MGEAIGGVLVRLRILMVMISHGWRLVGHWMTVIGWRGFMMDFWSLIGFWLVVIRVRLFMMDFWSIIGLWMIVIRCWWLMIDLWSLIRLRNVAIIILLTVDKTH